MASKRKGKEIESSGSGAQEAINSPQSWDPIQGSRAKECV